MRIVIDLDGTICELKKPHQTYADVLPMPGAAEAIRKLKQSEHTIIIHTARNMKTQNGNVGKVVANVGQVTLDWLERNGIVYDEIVFGKPYGDIYIDDLALSFEDWPSVLSIFKGSAAEA
jgi:capsule biosynthesis phosphatase